MLQAGAMIEPVRPSVCCPRCRLLQRAPLCAACGERTAGLAQLVRPRIEGLTRVTKPPPTGWRDRVALYTTAFGALGLGTKAFLMTGSPAALLVTPLVGLLGYRKQFWKTVFRRRLRLGAVPRPACPAGEALAGVAQRFDHAVGSAGRAGALAIATTIESDDGVILRAIDAAPFWLVVGDRRVLVTGACWLSGAAGECHGRVSEVLGVLGAHALPIATSRRQRLRVTRVRLAAGDRVSVLGRIREEQVPGAGGYRDALVETLRGEPGAPAWIVRIDHRVMIEGSGTAR